jgi:hypothetical protein
MGRHRRQNVWGTGTNPAAHRTAAHAPGGQPPHDRQAWARERIAKIRMGTPDTRAQKLGTRADTTRGEHAQNPPDPTEPETP